MQNPVRPVTAPREMSIFGAMWRYRRVVIVTVLVTVAAAVLYDITRPRAYVAEASLILQAPSNSASSAGIGAQEAARYTADQLTILRSPALVDKALQRTRQRFPDSTVTRDDFRNADLVSTGDSNVITIRFSGSNPRVAAGAANAIGQSYEEVRRSQLATGSAQALRRTDDEIAEINQRLGQISSELAELQSEPADDTRVTTLSQEQKTLLDQRATMLQQRSELSAGSRAPGPASIFIPVDRPVSRARSELIRILTVAVFLGLLIGAGIAYGLSLRRQVFADAAEIELVVQAPLLGEIPDFSSGRRTAAGSHVAVLDGPSAEAFRMVASAIASRAELDDATTLVVVSALRNEGKTTVVVNAAIAAATEGARVLVVDADPRGQGLSAVLESVPGAPLAERRPFGNNATSTLGGGSIPGTREEPLDERSVRVVSLPNTTLDLLPMVGSPSVNAWRSDPVRKFFQAAREAYDLVLIDTPDLLSASEASAVAVHADGAVVVIPEHSGVAEATEVVTRLRLVGIAPIGYVHNLASATIRRNHRKGLSASTGARATQ